LQISNGEIGIVVDERVKADTVSNIEKCYSQVVNILHDTARVCIPSVHKDYFKFWWDQELDSLKQLSISSHREWVRQGRPRQGPIFENKMKHKYIYKHKIK